MRRSLSPERRRLAWVAASVVAGLFGPSYPARAAEPGGVPLTLAEARARALSKNHAIALERESSRIASSLLLRAEGAYDPAFHLDARFRDHTDPVNSLLSGAPAGAEAPHQRHYSGSASVGTLLPTGATVSLYSSLSRDRTDSFFALLSPSYTAAFGVDVRQPLLQNFKIDPARRAIRVARVDRERSEASLRRTVTETVAAVERAYWALVAADRALAVRRSSVALAEEQRSDTAAKIEVGALPESDLAQPAAEIERRRGELLQAAENRQRAENLLKSLLLGDAADPLWAERLLATDTPETPIAPVDLARGLAEALANRPELRDGSLRVERQDVEIEAAKDRLLPQLDLVASYARRGLAGDLNPNGRSFTGTPVAAPEPLLGGFGRSLGTVKENRFPDASIGLSVTVPIGNRAAEAELAVARSAKSQAATSLEEARQRISVEVRNAGVALETAAQRIEAARAGRGAAETQLRAETERYGVGLSTNFFVLTRQNELAVARLTETAALTDYRDALAEWARATGTLLRERKIEIEKDAPAAAHEGGSSK